MQKVEELFREIQLIADNTAQASQATEVSFGQVTATEPLEIFVEQRLLLPESQIILTANTTETLCTMTNSVGTDEYLVQNQLAVGDNVLLLRVQGGQKYVVLSKLF